MILGYKRRSVFNRAGPHSSEHQILVGRVVVRNSYFSRLIRNATSYTTSPSYPRIELSNLFA
ncbi:MAG: hypothetical protein ACLGJB_24970 [Blastocatellia bacterium]